MKITRRSVKASKQDRQIEWSLEIIINVVYLGNYRIASNVDDTIRPALTRDGYGNKIRNIEEEQRYYKLLVNPVRSYIQEKANMYPDYVKYIETQNSMDSGAGYIFFTVDEDIYSIDLRVAEIEYEDATNIIRIETAQRKLDRFKARGIISKDSELILTDIIISTEDGKRQFENYAQAITFAKLEIDNLLKELLPEYLFM